jgi:hypothetical protein
MRAFLKTVCVFLISCLTIVLYHFLPVKSKQAEENKNSKNEKVIRLEKKLKRHGQLDKLVKVECDFTRKMNKANIAFYRDNVKHLENLDLAFKRLIFRHKDLTRTMTYEWGAVKEQLVLMLDGNINEPDMKCLVENHEKLLKIIRRIDELTAEQQSILLMWDNVKAEREKQLSKFNDMEAVLSKKYDFKSSDDDNKEGTLNL